MPTFEGRSAPFPSRPGRVGCVHVLAVIGLLGGVERASAQNVDTGKLDQEFWVAGAPPQFLFATPNVGTPLIDTGKADWVEVGHASQVPWIFDNRDRGPIADAGPNRQITAPTLALVVTLDGSGSSDPNGQPLVSYTWTGRITGPGVLPLPDGRGTITSSNPTVDVTIGPATTFVTLVVSDGTFTSASDSVSLILLDGTSPTITAPPDLTVEATDPAGAVVADLGTPIVNDDLDPNPVVTNNAPVSGRFPIGSTTVRWDVRDSSGQGRAAFQQVKVVDTTGPVVMAPPNQTVQFAGDPAGTLVPLGNATAVDAVSLTAVTLTNDAPAITPPDTGPRFPVGPTQVIWRATDAAGNVGTATQTVFVTDTVSPTIAAPPDLIVECTSAGGTPVSLGTPTVDDDAGPVTVTNDATGTFGLGTWFVTWTATDSIGNTAVATQTVRVVDTLPPTIIPSLGDRVEVCSSSMGQAVALGPVFVYDSCDPSPTVSNSAPPMFHHGSRAVTWLAVDDMDNVGKALQFVTIEDRIAPTFPLAPAPVTVPANTPAGLAAPSAASLGGPPAVIDECDPAPTVTVDLPSLLPLGTTTVTWTATDSSGNSATATQVVTVFLPPAPPTSELPDPNLVGFNDATTLIETTYRITIVDGLGAPVSGLTPLVNGLTMAETFAGSGVYEAGPQLVLPTTPIRATFTATAPSGPFDVTTDPTVPVPGLTVLNRGLVLSLSGPYQLDLITLVGGAIVDNTVTSHPDTLLTHGLLAVNGGGEFVAPPFETLVGPLYLFFSAPLAAPGGPAVRFARLPAGTESLPNRRRFLPFVLEVSDADLAPITSVQVVEARVSLDQGATFPFVAQLLPGDPQPFDAPPQGALKVLIWDTQGGPNPLGILDTTDVRLQVTVQEATGGLQASASSSAMWLAYDGPEVLSIRPTAGALLVPANAQVRVRFSEPMNPATIDSTTVRLFDVFGTPRSATISYDPATNEAVLVPTAPLALLTPYVVAVSQGITNDAAIRLRADFMSLFVTGDGAGLTDTDGDGLLDPLEERGGTDPNDPDTDNDGFLDGGEFAGGSNPLDPASVLPARVEILGGPLEASPGEAGTREYTVRVTPPTVGATLSLTGIATFDGGSTTLQAVENTRFSLTGVRRGQDTLTIFGSTIAPVVTQALPVFVDSAPIARPDPLLFVTDRDAVLVTVASVAPASVIETLAGGGSSVPTIGDGGSAVDAFVGGPEGVAVTSVGHLFVAESGAGSNRVRRVDAITGVITTIAGAGPAGFGGDGGPAIVALLDRPGALVVDAEGDVVVTDTGNGRVREIDTATGAIRTLAGGGSTSVASLTGAVSASQAALSSPSTLAVGPGALYVGVDGDHVVVRVDLATGALTRVAGGGASAAPAVGAPGVSPQSVALTGPDGLAVQGADLVIADGPRVLRLVGSTGLLQTDAVLTAPISALAIDARTGTTYVTFESTHELARLDASGATTRLAGDGVAGTGGFGGDGGRADLALLRQPRGLAVDLRGNLLVADAGNDRVRRVSARSVLSNDLDPDGDPLVAAVATPPAHGGLTLLADGSIVYTPQAGFTGFDSFTYLADDGLRRSSPAQVRIRVRDPADRDDDGLLDSVEPSFATDPDDPDTDGDGLLDGWEVNGVDVDFDGIVDLPLAQAPYSADPRHKDVFVEIDWATGSQPEPQALARVEQAFAQAPVTNPDGTTGIRLHLAAGRAGDVPGGQEATTATLIDSLKFTAGPLDPATSFHGIKARAFDPARATTFHYALLVGRFRAGPGDPASDFAGVAELWGNDLMIATDVVRLSPRPVEAEAGTLLHELGHNFYLSHGGPTDVTDDPEATMKPCYYSVMNYRYLFGIPQVGGDVDLARQSFPPSDETQVVESVALCPGAPYPPFDAPHDFNNDGDSTDVLTLDLDGNGRIGLSAAFADWDALRYDFQNGAGFAFGRDFQPVVTEQATVVTPLEASTFTGRLTSETEVMPPPLVRLTFDTLAPGTGVTDQFAGFGVRFQLAPGTTTQVVDAFAALGLPTRSAPNALQLVAQPGVDQRRVGLRIAFGGLVPTVGMHLGGGAAGQTPLAVLIAFDAQGRVLGAATTRVGGPITQFLGLRSVVPIREVLLMYLDSDVPETIDDLILPFRDLEAPELTVPPDVTVECTGPDGQAVAIGVASAFDVVDPSPMIRSDAPALFLDGTTLVTWTATDASGNTASAVQRVTVQDTVAPVLAATPPDMAVEQATRAGTAVTFVAPVATDVCDETPVVTCEPPSGAVFPLGAHLVTCTARDAAGNASSVTFMVTVVDTTSPELVAPPSITAEQANAAGTPITFNLITTDDACDATPTIVCTPPSGTVFPLGATDVTCRATDASGNTSLASFVVTVVDTTPPTFSSAGELVVEATGPLGAVVDYPQPAVSDVCDAAPTVVCAPARGTLFPPGTTTVECTATDAAGNSSTFPLVVRVVDTTPPVVEQLDDVTVEQATAAGTLVAFTSPTASDAVDASPVVACTPPSGTVFALGRTEVVCTATDSAGNVGRSSFHVTVVDTTPPVVSGPTDLILVVPPGVSVSRDDPVVAAWLAAASSQDVCDVAPDLTHDAPDQLVAGEQAPVTFVASDDSGNEGRATARWEIVTLEVRIVSPVDGACSNAPVTVTVSTNDPDGVLLSGTRQRFATVAPAGSGPTYVDEGDYAITATATTPWGNVEAQVSFAIDQTPPIVLVASPVATPHPGELYPLSMYRYPADLPIPVVTTAHDDDGILGDVVRLTERLDGVPLDVTSAAATAAASTESPLPGGHALLLPGLGGACVFQPAGVVHELGSGTAIIAGTIVSTTDPDARWAVSLWFERVDQAAPSLELFPIHYQNGDVDPDTWRLYALDEQRSRIVGQGSFAGETLRLSAPQGGAPALQVGVGANGRNLLLGASGRFGVRRGMTTSEALLNVDLTALSQLTEDLFVALGLPVLGRHVLAVEAEDRAGNVTTAQVVFEVVLFGAPGDGTLTVKPESLGANDGSMTVFLDLSGRATTSPLGPTIDDVVLGSLVLIDLDTGGVATPTQAQLGDRLTLHFRRSDLAAPDGTIGTHFRLTGRFFTPSGPVFAAEDAVSKSP